MVACLDRGNNTLPTIGCMKRYAVILAVLSQLLGACTIIGHEKVEGWPKLTVIEHYVPHREMRDRCVPYTPWGSSPEACAEFNLAARTCNLYFSADFPPPAFFVKHERMHCGCSSRHKSPIPSGGSRNIRMSCRAACVSE
jgi:hypothetical protein